MPDARRGVPDVLAGEREFARRGSEQRPSRPAPCRGHEALSVGTSCRQTQDATSHFLADAAPARA
jgi:hypothetical protein